MLNVFVIAIVFVFLVYSYLYLFLLFLCFPFCPPQCRHKAENIGQALGYNFFYVALLAQWTLQFHFCTYILHQTECSMNTIVLIKSLSLLLSVFITTMKAILIPCFSGSVYSVVAVALERYFNICKPFNRNLVSVFWR